MEQNWKDVLTLWTAADPWYQQCLREVQALEADFLEVRAALAPAQQDTLDRYIAACEELEHALTQLAYLLGREG